MGFGRKSRQPAVRAGSLTVFVEDDSQGMAMFDMTHLSGVAAEFGMIKLTIALLLENCVQVMSSPMGDGQSFVHEWGLMLVAMDEAPTWDAIDVLGGITIGQTPSARRVQHGWLYMHPDDTASVDWGTAVELGAPRSAEVAVKVAVDEALRRLSDMGKQLLLMTMANAMSSIGEHPELLDSGRRDFSAHALTMATAARAAQG
jgi:hypothetical protein